MIRGICTVAIIYKLNSKEDESIFMDNGLSTYNAQKCAYFGMGKTRRKKYLGFYVYDRGKKIGGVYGYIDPENWVYIALLYISDDYREKGIGSKLIALVEKLGRRSKCTGIRTETWDFQAIGFYEKRGFVVYGILEDHPIGATDYLLKKKF